MRLLGVQDQRVVRWASAPIRRGTLAADGSVADAAALTEVLNRLWSHPSAQGAPSRERVIAAIPGVGVVSKLLPAAGLDPQDPEAINRRIRGALPRAEAFHAWQMVGDPTSPMLFVVSAPTPLVTGYVDCLAAAGIGLLALDLKPLALVRGIGANRAVILDVEPARGSVIVVHDRLPREVRFPRLDAPLLTSSEAKVLRLVEALDDVLLRYAEGGGPPLGPAVPVYLTGSLFDQPLLRDAISTVLGHPIGRFQPLLEAPRELPLEQFAANLGLAYKQV